MTTRCSVELGSRSPAKVNDLIEKTSVKGKCLDFTEDVTYGDLVVLATLGEAIEIAIELAGLEFL